MKTSALSIQLLLIGLLFPFNLLADEPLTVLPNPLSLQKAIELMDPSHPDIELSSARLQQAQAELALSESKTGFKSYLDLFAARSKPSTYDEFVSDNYGRLIISKTLYDFGQSDAENNSFNALVDSREIQFNNERQRHQLQIMKRFLDVLLADLRYRVDDEEMTQLYLKYDKLRERSTLGMISPVELAKAENAYREALIARTTSDRNIQSSRLLLAIALNRPNDLPDELTPPDFTYLTDEVPEREELYQEALKSNPVILAAQKEVTAAQQQVVAQQNRNRPILSAQLELGEYERERESRDSARAQILLRVPIYQGGETRASVDRASALLFEKKARLKKLEQELLINIASIVKELSILQTKKNTAEQRLNYRDLDLEYGRALYEMEASTTFSEKQAKLTEAHWYVAKTQFEHALLIAELNVLLGKPLIPTKGQGSP